MENKLTENKYNKYIIAVSILIPVVVAVLFNVKLKNVSINTNKYFAI